MTTYEENLVLENMNLARDIAWKYCKKFGNKIPFEELESLAFLGLTKAAKTYNLELKRNFSTYAYTVITNEILLYYRNNKKHLNNLYFSSEINDEGIKLEEVLDSGEDITQYVDNFMIYDKLYKEIDNLKDRYKSIMQFRLEGLTMVEIGEKLNISQPQVSRDYQKALNLLRDRFKDWR